MPLKFKTYATVSGVFANFERLPRSHKCTVTPDGTIYMHPVVSVERYDARRYKVIYLIDNAPQVRIATAGEYLFFEEPPCLVG